MNAKMNVPELRFGEFSGEWEEKKLGEIAKRKTAKNKECNTNVLTISAQLGLISQLEFFNKSVSAKDVTGYYLLEKGDFAYNKSYSNGYPMGAIKSLKRYDKGVVSTLYICFSFDKYINLSFMEQYFETGIQNKEIEKVAQEGARNHGLLNIGLEDFFSIKIHMPTLIEQQKIASFLTSVDTKIEQLTKKKTLLEQYKKGVMQKIFSQEIRFKNDDGSEYPEWVEKKLGDLDIYISDGNYGEMYPKADEMKENGIPFIRANNIKNLKLTWKDMKYIDENLHGVLTSGHLETNDILVTTRGDIGMLAYVSAEFNNANINAQICLLRCRKNLNSFYMLQYLASVGGFNQFKKFQTGSALKQLPKKSLNDIEVPIPSLKEQTKIANFLSSLDSKLLHVEQQLNSTKQFKKALLQQMFV